MALPADLQAALGETPTEYGVVLAINPGDARFGVEFQRDTDSGGSPAGSPVTVGYAEAGQSTFVDTTPASSATFHYRARHVRDGYTDGAWTQWVTAKRDLIPPVLPPVPFDATNTLDVNVAESSGVVTIHVNSPQSIKSVRWKTDLTAFVDPTTGSFANTDASGDVDINPSVTLTVGQEVFVSIAYYGEKGAVGPVLGTARQSITYQVAISTLDELSANFGTITAGKIKVGSIEINADTERILMGAATAPLTGVGIFLGKDGAAYEFRAGDPAGDMIHWDGATLSIQGLISATSGSIGGWTISANALTSGNVSLNSSTERLLMGAASAPSVGVGIFLGLDGADYEFRAGDPAGAHIHWDATDLILTGSLITAPSLGSSPSLLGWANALSFSATDFDTVAWGTGAITLSDGTSFSIVAGNTGNMVATTYVYLDTDVSSTILQTTTTAATAIGHNKILVAVAKNATSPKDAEFQVYGGSGTIGVSKTIFADNIAADTITFNEILGNTITGAEINTMDLTAKTFTATLGTIGGWTLGSNTLSSLNISINSSTEQMLFGAASAILTGKGIFLGLDAGEHKFRVGDPATGEYFLWNGTNLGLFGDLRVGLGGQVSFYDTLSALQGSITPAGTGPTDGLDYAGNAHFGFSVFVNAGSKLVLNDDAGDSTYITNAGWFVSSAQQFVVSSAGVGMPSGKHFEPGNTGSTYYHGTGGAQHAFVVSNVLKLTVNATGTAVVGRLTMNATEKFYLDGGSNTYISESTADRIQMVTGGVNSLACDSSAAWIQAGDRLYLDGRSDTYISEVSANIQNFVVGGVEEFRIQSNAIILPNLTKFYLDGGGDTYIWEHTPNETRFVSGGVVMFTIGSNHLEIPAGKALYLDGGSNTYIQEVSADKVRIVTAGAEQFFVKTNGAGVMSGDRLFLDGGGDTYISEYTANAFRLVQAGTTVMETTTTGHQTINTFGTGNWVFRLHNNHGTNPWGILIDYTNAAPDDLSHRFFDGVDSTTTRISIYADGDIKNHDNSYGALSDARLKTAIVPAKSQWDDVRDLGQMAKNFRHITDVADGKDHVQLGLIAQEVRAISSGLVTEDPDGTLGVRYSVLYMKGIVALSEAQGRVEMLEKARTNIRSRLSSHAARIKDHEDRIKELELLAA